MISELSLAFEQMHFIDIDRLGIAKDGDDDRESHRHLRRRHRHYEKDEDLPVGGMEEACEGAETEIDCVEHQLDGHEDDQGVAPRRDADDPDGEEEGAQEEICPQGDHGLTPASVWRGPSPRPWPRAGSLMSARRGSGIRQRGPGPPPGYFQPS